MIVGVAIKHDGKLFKLPKPYRHIDIINYIRENTESRGVGILAGTNQGFYTEDGKYLSRQNAFLHAIACNQLTDYDLDKSTLFSEDLW